VDFDVDVDFKELVDVEESLLVVVALFVVGLDEAVPDLDVLWPVVTLADVVGGGTLESEVPYAVVEL